VLEEELRNQHNKYSTEIDGLDSEVFALKNTILRLELRNKKDLDAATELRR
jgi:hypothetical protein